SRREKVPEGRVRVRVCGPPRNATSMSFSAPLPGALARLEAGEKRQGYRCSDSANQRRATRVPHTRSCHVRRSESNHANQKPHPSSASDTSASTKREHAVRVSMREPSSRTSRNFQAREPTVAPTRTHDTTKYVPVTNSSHSVRNARSSRSG